MSEARLKHFGWGREGEGATADEEAFARGRAAQRFGSLPREEIAPPRLEDIKLAAPRLTPPAALAGICSSGAYDRAAHTYGKSYPEYVRGLN
ncbi:MAG TPA: FAD-binding oxidoreductase, partial [Xanthobacteraceae bacterium]|nr:FAD-binding oxidoreductase [Xanthobacteraceae bacterium]